MTTGDRRTRDRRQQLPSAAGQHRPPLRQERRRTERRRLNEQGGFFERRQLPRPQRVLLVDDDGDVRAVWREWLTLWHFTVVEAENGALAIDRAHERRPDIVLMDVTMPVLDGLSATAQLKEDPATARVPVLLMTADAAGRAPVRAARAGAHTLLPKPVRAQALLEAIRAAFRHVIAERMSGRGDTSSS